MSDVNSIPEVVSTPNPIESRKQQWQGQLDQIREQINKLQQQMAQLQQQGIMLEGAIQACDVFTADSTPASTEATK